jgi:hypothetical protein
MGEGEGRIIRSESIKHADRVVNRLLVLRREYIYEVVDWFGASVIAVIDSLHDAPVYAV